MKQIIVSKAIAYAAKVGGGTIAGINELALLDTGAIACFTEDNTLITSAGVVAEVADKKKIYIAVGNQVDPSKSFLTVPIPRLGTDYSKKAYAAPVKQKKFVGYDGVTVGTAMNYPVLVKGEEGQIVITDTTEGMRTIGTDIVRYSVNVLAGDTEATLTARLITLINADANAIVAAVATGANLGISLEAKDANTTFEVAVNGIISGATVVEKGATIEGVSVAPNFGEGTPDLILAMEDEASLNRGNSKSIELTDKYYNNHTLVTAGATYNVYTLYWMNKRNMTLGEQNTYSHVVRIAIAIGGPIASFETIMAEVFGNAETQENGA